MLLGGDELGRTQRGNNNAYCQDNEISWFDWDDVDEGLLGVHPRRSSACAASTRSSAAAAGSRAARSAGAVWTTSRGSARRRAR